MTIFRAFSNSFYTRVDHFSGVLYMYAMHGCVLNVIFCLLNIFKETETIVNLCNTHNMVLTQNNLAFQVGKCINVIVCKDVYLYYLFNQLYCRNQQTLTSFKQLLIYTTLIFYSRSEFSLTYSQFKFLLIIKYDIRSRFRENTDRESRKSKGGEGGVTDAFL